MNERGENYLFEYDLLDRVVDEIGFDGAKPVYKYNQAGELVYQQDALFRETFFRRDAMGRLINRLRSDASTVNYVYDECGRLIKAQTPTARPDNLRCRVANRQRRPKRTDRQILIRRGRQTNRAKFKFGERIFEPCRLRVRRERTIFLSKLAARRN